MLGATPSFCHAKGEEVRSKTTGSLRIARSGMWRLSVDEQSPESLEKQLQELFANMTDDLSVWENIEKQYSADLFVGLFMLETNEGLTISSETLKMISDRHLEIGFDIYAPDC